MNRIQAPRISKSQRENHSEIERKRRDRMKRDTEFLRKQLPVPHCKDKLSIFKAGAERLIQYTDKLGKREFILNDEEYSHLIMSHFDGFDIHIRCSDGKILKIHENAQRILGIPGTELIGQTLDAIAECSASTRQIISDALDISDVHCDISKGLVARSFTVALKCAPTVPARHCVLASDRSVCRFVEFCGDLVTSDCDSDDTDLKGCTVFRGLCRPLDPASPCLQSCDLQTEPCAGEEVLMPSDASVELVRQQNLQHFTLRLSPDTLTVVEAVGDCLSLLGCDNSNLLHKRLPELVAQTDAVAAQAALNEVLLPKSRPVTFRTHLIRPNGSVLPSLVRLSAIRLGNRLHCLVCKFTLSISPAATQMCAEHLAPPTQEMTGNARQNKSPENSLPVDPLDQQLFSFPLLEGPSQVHLGTPLDDPLDAILSLHDQAPDPMPSSSCAVDMRGYPSEPESELTSRSATFWTVASQPVSSCCSPLHISSRVLSVDSTEIAPQFEIGSRASANSCASTSVSTRLADNDKAVKNSPANTQWYENVDTTSFQNLWNGCQLPDDLEDILDGAVDF